MKTIKMIKLLLCMLILNACANEDQSSDLIDVGIEISIRSTEGVDLLNPNIAGHMGENQIRIYHFINGESVEVKDPNLDVFHGFLLVQSETHYRIRVFVNESSPDDNPVT